MTAVLVVGTMDTKGRECAYLADRIRELGCEVVVMDVGILGEADEIRCDITRRAVAEAAGTTLEALRHAGSRGKAVEGMREGARRIARTLKLAEMAIGHARRRLEQKGLILYRSPLYQVLALPEAALADGLERISLKAPPIAHGNGDPRPVCDVLGDAL